ncbi:MAG: hypothetical protein EAZ08_08075 [Cytophagales bacterium]|nr:MAG: hypothetical protein EAZ08_08075 [Cytophagales bacterium]
MSNKPIIFLAFANDKEDNARYLRNLPREMDGIRKALQKAVQAGLCEVIERANVTIENILDIFQDSNYKDRIAVFHYGGHADGYQLLLENYAPTTLLVVGDLDSGLNNTSQKRLLGYSTTNSVAHGEGLVSFFARQKGLKLVFFNGCSTQQQSLELVAAGIPAVIGTSNSINDDIATDLAIRFYKAIGNGANLERAWNEAIDQVKIQQGTTNLRGLYRKQEKEVLTDRFPWEILWREGAEIIKNWNLPETVDNPLFGLPEVIQTHLPEKPYRFLERYHKEDAEIFFGRSYYIRDLYNRATDKNAAPVILLYGQSGVGKSSLLDAGLLPRLSQVANVCYIRRDSTLGLLDTFKKALGIISLSSEQVKITTIDTQSSNDEAKRLNDSANSSNDEAKSIVNKQIELISLALEIAEGAEKQTLSTLLQNLEKKKENFYAKNITTYQNNEIELLEVWKSKEKDLPFIVLLDQAEECYTRANPNLPNELEDFSIEIQKIFSDPQNQPKGKLILSYRKEYHPEIKEVFKTFSIPREEIFLKSISQKDIIEIVKGLTLTEKLRRTYRLNVEETLPAIIADDLLEDKESPIAPVLQILLTKMWQLSEKEELRYFSVKKYQELKQQGILMNDFFHEQVNILEKKFPELQKTGLHLDLLHHHTTKLGTADSKNLEELREIYKDRQALVEQLLGQCKDLYLLSDASQNKTGLAHDTLAPIIQQEFRNSDKAGQRAAIILENKLVAFEQNNDTYIDVDDLRIVEQGKSGMKFWTKKEQELIDKSTERKRLLEEKDKRTKRLKNTLFTIIAVVGVLSLLLAGFAFQQYKEADLQKQTAQKNFEQADKLVNAFYFYEGKFAIAFNNNEFYFMDKRGDRVEKLGSYSEANNFDDDGWASVIDFYNTKYLLDTIGNKYAVAYLVQELDTSKKALDLRREKLINVSIPLTLYPQLEVLRLDRSQYKEDSLGFPNEILSISHLKYLGLKNCWIDKLPTQISQLTNLQNLDLSNNNLTILPPQIGELQSLTVLDLNTNPIDSLPKEIGKLKNLTVLNLVENYLTKLPTEIGNLVNLEEFYIDKNQIEVLPKEIGNLTHLITFQSYGNQLTTLPKEIGNLKKLRTLTLYNNKLSKMPAEIGELSNLKELDLSTNQLTSLPTEIEKLKNLQKLDLSGNQFSEVEKVRIRQLLPHCKVIFD